MSTVDVRARVCSAAEHCHHCTVTIPTHALSSAEDKQHRLDGVCYSPHRLTPCAFPAHARPSPAAPITLPATPAGHSRRECARSAGAARRRLKNRAERTRGRCVNWRGHVRDESGTSSQQAGGSAAHRRWRGHTARRDTQAAAHRRPQQQLHNSQAQTPASQKKTCAAAGTCDLHKRLFTDSFLLVI